MLIGMYVLYRFPTPCYLICTHNEVAYVKLNALFSIIQYMGSLCSSHQPVTRVLKLCHWSISRDHIVLVMNSFQWFLISR